jgi:hypothetical protein
VTLEVVSILRVYKVQRCMVPGLGTRFPMATVVGAPIGPSTPLQAPCIFSGASWLLGQSSHLCMKGIKCILQILCVVVFMSLQIPVLQLDYQCESIKGGTSER